MKKLIALLSATVLLCSSLSGCGNSDSSPSNNSSTTNDSSVTQQAEESTTTTTTTTKQTTTTTTTARAKRVTYLKQQNIMYDDVEEAFEIRFALFDDRDKAMSAPGTAKVKITDDDGNVVYDKTLRFSTNDFFYGTDISGQEHFLCRIYVPLADVGEGTNTIGTMSVTISGSDYSFESFSDKVYNIPQKKSALIIPETPIKFTYHCEYLYTVKGTITDITYEISDYDIELTYIFTVDNIAFENCSDLKSGICWEYKLTDSEGIIVDSGTHYGGSSNSKEGDKIKTTENIWVSLDPSETYTLTIETYYQD